MATSRRRPPIPGPIGRLAARVYGSVMALRNRRYDAGRGVTRFDRPVISVGNLCVGGTGKTPMVAHVVRTLRDHGRTPCIAMRGYASRRGLSDEADEYRRLLIDVPVVAQADRVAGLFEIFATDEGEKVDVIVLDDGFQHRRIARDLDLVLIDATRGLFDDRLLPAGHLREPVESLLRADAIILTHTESVTAEDVRHLRQAIASFAPVATIAECRHEWESLRQAAGDSLPVGWLRGKRIVGACAIGNPGAFLDQLAGAIGAPCAGTLVLRDHDPFAAAQVRRLIDMSRSLDAQAIVITEKDWSKLAQVRPEAWPCPVVRPRLSMGFAAGKDEIDRLILDTRAGE